MSFASEFASYFTSEEQESELVSILTLIGANAELAISQELALFALQATDYSLYSEDQLRSLLAYLLVPVRYKTAPQGTVNITIDYASGSVTIPVDKIVMDSNGRQWLSKDALFLRAGENADFTCIQGEESVISGTYSDFIAAPITGIDLETIELTLAGSDVPRLGVDYEGFLPENGFFAFTYNSVLYVRIFPGDDVPSPEGLSYELTYLTTDGRQGNITANQMASFLDTIKDEHGEDVQYTLSNAAITNGSNQPARYELFNTLRYWFFVKDSVSSIPEYKIFFLAQPELGDCFVEGDYERYKRTGVLTVTGKVEAVLMRSSPDVTYGYHVYPDTTLLNTIEERLAAVRDVGITVYSDFGEIQHNFLVKFISATDIEAFQNSVRTAITNAYSLAYCRDLNVSLFEGIDISFITDQIDSTLLGKGVEIIPYFYREVVPTGTSVAVDSYEDIEKAETTYVYSYEDGGTHTFNLVELEGTDGVVYIYEESDLSTPIGVHDYTKTEDAITMSWSEFGNGSDRLLQVNFLMEDRSFLRVGEAKSIRVAGDVNFELYTI